MKIKLYTPHSGQLPLHQSQARFRVATCGRRWGKTYACINEIVKFAWETPGAITWWVAPSYQQTQIAARIMLRHFKDAVDFYHKGEKMLVWKSGSYTFFKSTDNYDNLRGEGVSFMVVDEAAMIPQEAWYEALRPTLSDNLGKCIIVSTPKGHNWFYREWSRGQDPDEKNYQSWNFPTSSNPYIDAQEVEEARKTLPHDIFRQEYLAEFLEDSSGVFKGIRKCIMGELEPPKPGHKYILGWDLAQLQDYSVVTVIDTRTNHVVAWDRFNQIDWDFQLRKVRDIARKYKAPVWFDATGIGQPLERDLRRMGLKIHPFKFTAQSKQQLVQLLAVHIEQQKITFPELGPLIHELSVFEYKITGSGHIKYEAPAGEHDDCVMSLALALWGANQNPGIQFYI